MPTTAEPSTNGTPETLEDELHKLEAEEELLATRTRRLEFSNPVALILSIIAVALALGALLVTLAHYDNMASTPNNSSAATSSGSAASATSGMHMTSGATSNGMMM